MAETEEPEGRIIDPDFWRQMRAIMYQPTAVWMATSIHQRRPGWPGVDRRRWLTDQFVLLDITDSPDFAELPDGGYKLTVSKGPEPREVAAWPNMTGYLGLMDDREWKLAEPTDWSVAEHPGKAMLWSVDGQPALFGEPTWTQLKRFYPDCTVECSFKPDRDGALKSIFRFTRRVHDLSAPHDWDTFQEGCSCPYSQFAYAAGIRIPDGQEVAAKAVCEAL